MASASGYYLPHQARWPIIGSIGLTLFLGGFGAMLIGSGAGPFFMVLGLLTVLGMMAGWFGEVINEGLNGLYDAQVERSFRWGMIWFIASEVMFFAAFFGSLFYVRMYAVPWLGGEGTTGVGAFTHLLWPDYAPEWPTNGPAHIGGEFEPMEPWGLPALNTLILLSSGATVTWAHWGLLKNDRSQFVKGLIATIALGFLFVGFQAYEYYHAYTEMGLTLGAGIYGSTFFMLTGFHGFHVTIGTIFLAVVLLRALRGHFDAEHHFAFEAAAWYWHFVDVVWLGLFIFVYWL
ncbi:cytochrome c oxidase subunit III [Methylomarinovum caldicuralii]|uniref:cytochrome-c oxidase n=1 Tax=Methylomarinovum caldicuralii TaxID=438856 RepID=A0AAU9C9Y9_9GAMM|nr:cytochrome c oxidase subunit 3 [Methylomarinovum caldicuralii]BCX82401.1 cytochrome c oxidase subunit III [Methylomarinovum caldicuralii]